MFASCMFSQIQTVILEVVNETLISMEQWRELISPGSVEIIVRGVKCSHCIQLAFCHQIFYGAFDYKMIKDEETSSLFCVSQLPPEHDFLQLCKKTAFLSKAKTRE